MHCDSTPRLRLRCIFCCSLCSTESKKNCVELMHCYYQYEATCRYFSRTAPPPIPDHASQSNPEIMSSIPLSALLLAGGVAGVVGWLATFPLDVVKTRIQGSETQRFVLMPSPIEGTRLLDSAVITQEKNPYSTTWSTITHSYRTEGLRVFYRGLAPTLIR
jgi:solute carrier family 25 (mitochondrial carnitine/acylcarnitine transporter), member 20/29